MGRFSYTLLLVAASGCVDLGSSPSTNPSGGNDEGATPQPDQIDGPNELVNTSQHPAPISCGQTTLAAGEVAHAMSIASSPTGNTKMFGLQDGAVVGLRLDHGGMSGTASKLRTGDNLLNVSGTYAGDNLVVATTTTDGTVFVDLVDPNLDKFVEIAKLEGGTIAHTPIVDAQGAWLVPSIDAAGLSLAGFDHHFTQTNLQLFETVQPPIAVAAANFGAGGAVIAWSTAEQCTLAFASSSFSVASSLLHACPSVQLASDAQGGTSVIVFETAEGVMIAQAPHQHLQPATLLHRNASSPHVVFDGSKYWVSFLDMRGQVIVGYLDADGQLTSSALPLMQPDHDAFDLTVIGGSPYVVAADSAGYTSHRICTK
ncbi:MAG: hypothetical protein NT062_07445 [Proteobacteria bacterium]|nr:hypothetical protein [Pseudomonadota bacterium]